MINLIVLALIVLQHFSCTGALPWKPIRNGVEDNVACYVCGGDASSNTGDWCNLGQVCTGRVCNFVISTDNGSWTAGCSDTAPNVINGMACSVDRNKNVVCECSNNFCNTVAKAQIRLNEALLKPSERNINLPMPTGGAVQCYECGSVKLPGGIAVFQIPCSSEHTCFGTGCVTVASGKETFYAYCVTSWDNNLQQNGCSESEPNKELCVCDKNLCNYLDTAGIKGPVTERRHHNTTAANGTKLEEGRSDATRLIGEPRWPNQWNATERETDSGWPDVANATKTGPDSTSEVRRSKRNTVAEIATMERAPMSELSANVSSSEGSTGRGSTGGASASTSIHIGTHLIKSNATIDSASIPRVRRLSATNSTGAGTNGSSAVGENSANGAVAADTTNSTKFLESTNSASASSMSKPGESSSSANAASSSNSGGESSASASASSSNKNGESSSIAGASSSTKTGGESGSADVTNNTKPNSDSSTSGATNTTKPTNRPDSSDVPNATTSSSSSGTAGTTFTTKPSNGSGSASTVIKPSTGSDTAGTANTNKPTNSSGSTKAPNNSSSSGVTTHTTKSSHDSGSVGPTKTTVPDSENGVGQIDCPNGVENPNKQAVAVAKNLKKTVMNNFFNGTIGVKQFETAINRFICDPPQ